jgi:hypothetical protein
MNNYVDLDMHKHISFCHNNTRGHRFKLVKRKFTTDLSKFSFFNRVVDPWNALPAYVVESESLSAFKCNLTKLN